jgi:transcription elongation factor Elf1
MATHRAPERRSGKLRSGVGQMAETFKCPHCGAMYEITQQKSVSRDEKEATDCLVCGKQMEATNSSSIRSYELVKMPDGTSV